MSSKLTEVKLNYRSLAIPEHTAINVARSFVEIFDSIDPEGTHLLVDIGVLSERDLQRILDGNHKPPAIFSASIHKVFGRRVAESPESSAVCAWYGEFAYSQFKDLLSRLAQRL